MSVVVVIQVCARSLRSTEAISSWRSASIFSSSV